MISMKDEILLQILAIPPWREPHSPRETTPLLPSCHQEAVPSLLCQLAMSRGEAAPTAVIWGFQHRAGPSLTCSISRKWPCWGIVIGAEQSKLADTIRLMDWGFSGDSGKMRFSCLWEPRGIGRSFSPALRGFYTLDLPFLFFVFKQLEKSICKFISFLPSHPCLFSASRLEFYRGASVMFVVALNSLV